MKKLIYLLGIICLMASCSEDYTNWADPQSNPSEEPSIVELSVEPAAPVVFADVTAETLQLFIPSVTTNEEGVTTTYEYDTLGQLTRVNDPNDPTAHNEGAPTNNGTTWVYAYDRGGNPCAHQSVNSLGILF